MTKKSGMTAVALEKVRTLKSEIKRLSEELIASHDRCDGLRKVNEHASVVCGNAQSGAKLLRIALFNKAVDNDKLTGVAKTQGDEISRLKAELANWIANPVNKELDEHNKHLSEQNQTLFIQGSEFKNQRDQLLDANAGLARDIERQDSVIKRLRGTVNSFKAAYVEAKNSYEKLRAGALKTNEIYNKELAKERSKHDIRLVGAKQRITELEAALNYFNGLHQKGDDHKASSQERIGQLSEQLDRADMQIESLKLELARRNSVIEGLRFQKVDAAKTEEIRVDAKSFEKLFNDRLSACNRSPGESIWTKVWNWIKS